MKSKQQVIRGGCRKMDCGRMSVPKKNGQYRKRPIAAMIFAAMLSPASYLYATDFAQEPFLGVGSSYPPNVLLALSVEYPTAGAAYNSTTYAGGADNNHIPNDSFGMFWSVGEGIPTLSKQDFETKSFIGYFDQGKCYSYAAGGYFSPVGNSDSMGYCGSGYSGKALNWLTMTAIDIYRMTMTGGNRALGLGTGSAYVYGDRANFTSLRRAYVDIGSSRVSNGFMGMGVRRISKDLMDTNRVFPKNGVSLERDGSLWVHNSDFRMAVRNGGDPYQLGTVNNNVRYLRQKNSTYRLMNVVVEVCKPGFLEANCRNYGENYKPEGLMQANVNKMRFGVLGYLNNTVDGEADNTQQGGVLRARMKSLLGERTAQNRNLGAEINLTNGVFPVNPDAEDASSSGVMNSGVINYLNKFGDSGLYRTNDPAGELYYAGLHYLRGKQSISAYNTFAGVERAKDNFPVITDWHDPILQQGQKTTDAAAVCRPNYMMYIGDTNTHHDNHVPNFNLGADANPGGDVATASSLSELLAQEGNKAFRFGESIGARSGESYGSIAGLAYWARTNDIRDDVKGNQYLHSIFIDVLENSNYKSSRGEPNRNAFYWAAKYGGFDADEAEINGAKPEIRNRSQWTHDAEGQTSIEEFSDGVPKTFAAANTPEQMVQALRSAFNNVAAKTETPSQTALGLEHNSGRLIDASAADKAVLLQSSYKKNDYGWQGDVLAFEYTASGYREKWKLSAKLDAAFRDGKANNRKVWSMVNGSVEPFSSGNAAKFREALALNTSQPNTGNAANLIQYVLGDSQYEKSGGGDVFRTRPSGGLMGTVINSTVGVLAAPTESVCAKSDSFDRIKSRATVYAFAANDGMLHVIDKDGNEKFAYMPSTALPKLKDYASTQGSHVYINDGSPVMKEVCLSDKQASVIVGTTGQGGEAVYAINASQMGMSNYTPSADEVLWEFTKKDDADLGLTVHQPIITTVKEGNNNTPVAIVSGGYNSGSGKGHLYVLKLNKSRGSSWTQGVNYWKIPLGETGIGAPKVIDDDGDGNADRIYVGDEKGKLWRADFNGSWSAKSIFDAGKPITGAPDVARNGSGYTVVFSTGQYFTSVHNNAMTNEQNYAYGLFDKEGTLISANDLLDQSVETMPATVSNGGARSYYKVSKNTVQSNHKGWRLQLPKGLMSTDSAYVRSNRVAQFFAFGNNGDMGAGNVCSASGQTAVIEVDVNTGGLHAKKLFDTNQDNRFDANDAHVGVMITNEGMALKRINTIVTNQTDQVKRLNKVIWVDDAGKIRELGLNPLSRGFRRLSWREIFF